jgi:hypothetical protein
VQRRIVSSPLPFPDAGSSGNRAPQVVYSLVLSLDFLVLCWLKEDRKLQDCLSLVWVHGISFFYQPFYRLFSLTESLEAVGASEPCSMPLLMARYFKRFTHATNAMVSVCI